MEWQDFWLELAPTEFNKSKESNTKLREPESVNGGAVKYAAATAQIAAVRQQDTDAAENADSRLNPGVEQPFL